MLAPDPISGNASQGSWPIVEKISKISLYERKSRFQPYCLNVRVKKLIADELSSMLCPGSIL